MEIYFGLVFRMNSTLRPWKYVEGFMEILYGIFYLKYLEFMDSLNLKN